MFGGGERGCDHKDAETDMDLADLEDATMISDSVLTDSEGWRETGNATEEASGEEIQIFPSSSGGETARVVIPSPELICVAGTGAGSALTVQEGMTVLSEIMVGRGRGPAGIGRRLLFVILVVLSSDAVRDVYPGSD